VRSSAETSDVWAVDPTQQTESGLTCANGASALAQSARSREQILLYPASVSRGEKKSIRQILRARTAGAGYAGF